MWNEIIPEIVSTYLIPALMALLTGIATWIGTKIKMVIEEKAKNEKTKDIIYNVVKYVEQTSKSLTSSDKFERAVKNATEWLSTKGIEISTYELEMMIEATVNELYGNINKKGE